MEHHRHHHHHHHHRIPHVARAGKTRTAAESLPWQRRGRRHHRHHHNHHRQQRRHLRQRRASSRRHQCPWDGLSEGMPSWYRLGRVRTGRKAWGEEGGGGYSFVARLSHLAIAQTSFFLGAALFLLLIETPPTPWGAQYVFAIYYIFFCCLMGGHLGGVTIQCYAWPRS